MSSYPGALDSFTDGVAGQPLNSPSLVDRVNELNAALVAVQTALGINPQANTVDVKTRLAAGLGLRQIVTFTSSGTFTKADYPWLRVVRALTQGAGAGGAPAIATGSTGVSAGAGGSGGACGISIVNVEDLLASETVTVGAGGDSTTSGSSAGGNSSFGSHASGSGGLPSNTVTLTTADNVDWQTPSVGQSVGVGNIVVVPGSPGGPALISRQATNRALGGFGGGSHLGSGGRGFASGATQNAGQSGNSFGGGGGGSANSVSQVAIAGGIGGPGVVVLELYG